MKLVLANSNLSLLCTIHSKDANGELDLYKNRCKRNAESLHEPLLHLLQCDALHIHEFRNRRYIFDDMKRINSFKMVRRKIPGQHYSGPESDLFPNTEKYQYLMIFNFLEAQPISRIFLSIYGYKFNSILQKMKFSQQLFSFLD